MRDQYMPPPLDQALLFAVLRKEFPAHKKSPELLSQLHELVMAYLVWWQLMLTFPERRIVATAPIWIVRKIHSREFDRFLFDCLGYLGRIPQKEDLWGGPLDFRGTNDTARSLREKFDNYQLAWEPILKLAEEQRKQSIVRIY